MKRTICHQKGGKLAMLQLTRKADYGLRLMLEAAAARDSFVTTRSVAKRQEIPYPFLRRAAAALAEKGLLITARGPQGGVRLAKPASAVTLLDIANAFGGVALNACTEVPARCDRRRACPAFPAWVEAQTAVDRALAGTDLESLLDRSQPRESTTGTEELLMSGFTGAAACGPDN
jgi:Rrf2 family protein